MGMTIDEYRNRMIKAFHNAECDNLIALVVLPSEKEFEHLEWLLKNHYKTPKEQYEARLKADMVAMLEVIKLRIDNLPEPLNHDRVNYCIQEKINALKEDQDENNNEI